jgi:hypothetical protein
MATTRLAYNPTSGGSGTGYAAYSPSSNVAIAASGWTTEAGDFKWWMSPNNIPGTAEYIGRVTAGEDAGVGPWTWNFNGALSSGTTPSNSICSNNGRFDNNTAAIFISEATYTGIRNSIGQNINSLFNTGTFQIFVRGVGDTAPFYLTYQVTGVSLNSSAGVHTINVTYVGGATGQPVDGQRVAISVRSNALPKNNRSGGTFSFFFVDWGDPQAAARLGVILGIPTVTITDTQAQVKTKIQASSSFWASW